MRILVILVFGCFVRSGLIILRFGIIFKGMKIFRIVGLFSRPYKIIAMLFLIVLYFLNFYLVDVSSVKDVEHVAHLNSNDL
jgi:hypothetical protein